MSEESDPTTESVKFYVKSANNAKFEFDLPLSTTTIELKNKLSTEDYANVPAAQQRLIYSGRVLKDEDTLATHKVKAGNTMHLVKSAASNQRQAPASQSTPNSTGAGSAPQAGGIPGVPNNIAAGTGNDPFAALTGARYAGFSQLPGAGMFGPDGGVSYLTCRKAFSNVLTLPQMGPPPSIENMQEMLRNPNFSQMMNEALQNPQVIDMMIQQNPQLRAMGPQARQMLQSPQFRAMMTNPDALRQMSQLSRTMGLGGFGGGGGGGEAFPAPGVTNTTPADSQNTQATQPEAGVGAQQNPFAALMGGAGGGLDATSNANQNSTTPSTNLTATQTQNAQQNPLAMLFNPAMMGQGQTGDGSNNAVPPNPFANNPYVQDPAALRAAMQALGGGGQAGNGAANPFGSLMDIFGGAGAAPPDNRPPEERFATQLRQLNEMGFFDFDRNIQALSRSGGDVNGALEWLFSQSG